MSRYDWPGELDPATRDDARGRGESIREFIRRFAARIQADASALRAQLLTSLNPDSDTDVWVPIGPSETIRGQGGSQPRVAGRIRDLAVSDEGSRIYAASSNGGVWYSGDAGDSWLPVGGAGSTAAGEAAAPGPSSLVTNCLAVKFGASTDGSDDIVYAGTGERRPYLSGTPGSENSGIGILKLNRSIPDVINDPYINPWTREASNLTGAGVFQLAMDPADPDIVVAATSVGLFKRDSGGSWTRVTTSPFDFDSDDNQWCTDVVWTPAAGGVPKRLWVALIEPATTSNTNIWFSDAGPDGPYTEINLDGVNKYGRLGLAFDRRNPAVGYVLGKGPKLWRIDGTTARVVRNIPNELFGSGGKDSSFHNLAVAVHPTNANQVVIAGSTVKAEATMGTDTDGNPALVGGSWAASMFRLTVTGTAAADDFSCNFDPANQTRPGFDTNTFIGANVHADVHALRFAGLPAGSQLWVGCDGGVYRSNEGGENYSFRPRNKGLAVTETGYVANHPTNDAVVITGTQDNGAQVTIGETISKLWVWGDGGGLAFHPTLPAHHIGQYTRAKWYINKGSWNPPVYRNGAAHQATDEKNASDAENSSASFYSDLDVIPGVGNNARVAIGTNRVWISEDWNPSTETDNTWVTLPTKNDPRRVGETNVDQDIRSGTIKVVKWAGRSEHPEDRVIAVYNREVVVFNRSGLTWTPTYLNRYDEKCGDDEIDNDDIPQPTSPFLPPIGAWSDIEIHNPDTGAHGTFYVATTGFAEIVDDVLVEADRMDTLWWFDGTDTWHPTGLRNDANATKAPALAVVVDPADKRIVYVGTSVGVWRGEFSTSGGQPQWQWRIFSNGLPDAVVQDLSFFRNTDGSVKLLRAALQSRGVWEVDLSPTPGSPRRTFLRAHAFDARRQFPTNMTDPTSSDTPPAEFTIYGSPDIRIRPAPGSAVPPRPTTLPWRRTSGARRRIQLWSLQTAMHHVDKQVRPTARWTQQFDARVRHHRAANSLATPEDAVVDIALWNTMVTAANVWQRPWDSAEASEGDLFELIQEAGYASGIKGMDNREIKVDVMVHHRHFQPLATIQVRVLLLMRRLTGAPASDAGVSVSAAWKSAVVSRLGGGSDALLDNWQVVGLASPSSLLLARSPRGITFDLDLSSTANFPMFSRWILLAVVSAFGDEISTASLAGNTLEDLVRGSHHVAAKRIGIKRDLSW